MSVERKIYLALHDSISTWLHQAVTEDKCSQIAAYNCMIHALTRSVNDVHEAKYNELLKMIDKPSVYKPPQPTEADWDKVLKGG